MPTPTPPSTSNPSTSNPLTFNPRPSKHQTDERKQRNYLNLKPAYQAMNWKNYTMTRPRNISLQESESRASKADRLSARNPTTRAHQSPSYYQPPSSSQHPPSSHPYLHNANTFSSLTHKKHVHQQNLRQSGVTYTTRLQQHATRVKQDALRRVKLLQQKVLPLISTQKHPFAQQNSEEYGFAWQMRMEQRLVRVEHAIEKVRHQVEVKCEKRVIEVEREWAERVRQLLEGIGLERIEGLEGIERIGNMNVGGIDNNMEGIDTMDIGGMDNGYNYNANSVGYNNNYTAHESNRSSRNTNTHTNQHDNHYQQEQQHSDNQHYQYENPNHLHSTNPNPEPYQPQSPQPSPPIDTSDMNGFYSHPPLQQQHHSPSHNTTMSSPYAYYRSGFDSNDNGGGDGYNYGDDGGYGQEMNEDVRD